MPKYRKRPLVVDAIQWTGDNKAEVLDFVEGFDRDGDAPFGGFTVDYETASATLWVEANKSWLPIEKGEWILRDAKGYYPCKDDIFRATYDKVSD